MNKIKKIAVYTNKKRDIDGIYTKKTIEELISCGTKISVLDDAELRSYDGKISFAHDIDGLLKDAEALIMLGGDGTMLDICGAAAKYDVPVFGINLGHLGFLTSVEKDNTAALFDVISGNYTVEERMMLSVNIDGKHKYDALNDVTVFTFTTFLQETGQTH